MASVDVVPSSDDDDKKHSPKPHILFLTTHDLSSTHPHNLSATHENWNLELLPSLAARSISVTTLSYLTAASSLTPAHIASTYTHISLLLLGHYPPHHSTLVTHLKTTLPAALKLNPNLRIWPGIRTALWNADKSYLRDLRSAGFPVPETNLLSPRQPLEYVRFALSTSSHGHGVVVKPSVSASSWWTHLVRDPSTLTDEDDGFLAALVSYAQGGNSKRRSTGLVDGGHRGEIGQRTGEVDGDSDRAFLGSIMLQEYIPEITDGEYSLCFVGGRHLYTILKSPRNGGWQVNAEHGGSYRVISEPEVPRSAREVSEGVVAWLQQERFPDEELVYARIDGVVRTDGGFVLMEVELLEPSLFLDLEPIGRQGIEALCDCFARDL